VRLRTISVRTSTLLAVLAASALAFTAPAGAATSVSNPIPQAHEGAVCKAVRSAGGWNATICAMTNENDAQIDPTAQALITYTIRSGTVAWVSASNVHSLICTPICGFTFSLLSRHHKWHALTHITYALK